MKVKTYPHIENISNMESPEDLLNDIIYWEVKEDGSNVGMYIDDEHNPHVCSRNQGIARFEDSVLKLDCIPNIYNMIDDLEFETGHKFIVYGEFMTKGKSPTGIKVYDRDDLKVFDIYDINEDRFLHYHDMYNLCADYEIPMVKLVCITKSKDLKRLYINADIAKDVVDNTKTRGVSLKLLRRFRHYTADTIQEGVVGKCYHSDGSCTFVKNKFKRERIRHRTEDFEVKQVLPRSVIREKVWNVYVELSDDFFDVRKAMPRIAEVVNEEAKQTDSIYVDNIFDVYQEVLCDIQEVRNDII